MPRGGLFETPRIDARNARLSVIDDVGAVRVSKVVIFQVF